MLSLSIYLSDRTILEPLTINNIMKHLNHMSDQWIRVANILKLPSFVISSVQVSQFGNDQASLRKVVEWWFKSTANPEWNVIQQLYGKFTSKGGTFRFVLPAESLMSVRQLKTFMKT